MHYWSDRQNLSYYQQAVDWAKDHTPAGGKILDVGGGVTMGCRYLEWLDGYDRTSVELRHGNESLPGVRLIISAFEDWTPDQHYDTVLCLQCVEHVPDPEAFIRKLLAVADRLILSVPYLWPAGLDCGHLHDPIDRQKVREWACRDPVIESVSGTKPWERLMGLYDASNAK